MRLKFKLLELKLLKIEIFHSQTNLLQDQNIKFSLCDLWQKKVDPDSRVVKVLSGLLRVCVSASVLIRGIARFLSDIGQVKF